MTAYGIMAAIVARERFGIGQKIETSLLAAMMVLQGLSIGLQLYHKKDDMIGTLKTDRTKARNPLWNHYKCGDGKWLMLAMLQPDRQWSDLCKGLGIEYLEKDPKFDNILTRMENSAELISIMDEKFLTRAAEEWVKTLKAAGDIICTPIQTINDLENDPQVLANNYLINAHHEVIGDVKALGVPVYFSKTPGSVNCTAPEFGQHNEEILMDLGGYSWEEISALKEEEVIL
jgi:crotonobetainyl-CoA:carnitine CoA-transferase CaiB-like acyl-CoA transferase